MEPKSLKKNAFYSVLKVFLSLVFPLITFPYASRILLPEGIGKINFANSIVSYFILMASLGIGSYATREAAKVREDKNAVTKLFKEIITINFICCLIAYILFFISLFAIPKFSEYRTLLLVCCIKILFSVIGFDWIFAAFEEFKYITIRSFFVQLLSLVYLFVFVHTKDDIVHYAVFGILTTVGSNILNFFFIGKYIDVKYHPKLEIKKHLKAIMIFFGMTVVTSVYTMLDTTMLGFLSNDIQVGFYTASTKLSHMILSMLTAITGVLLPRLTSYAQNNDSENFQELVNKSSNIIILLSIPMTTGLILLAKPLIILLTGESYIDAIPAMITISPIVIVITFGSLIGVQILPAINKEKKVFYSYIAGAVTNISLNAIFIPKLGALGAAIGTVAAESIVCLIQIFFARKFILNKLFFITLLESFIASILMGIGIFAILKLIPNLYIQLLLSVITGVIIYSIILFIFKNKYFIYYTEKLLKRRSQH